MPAIIENKPHINEFVYASPVYGGFQIALSAYCQNNGKKATIFCAKRNTLHPNTLKCLDYGANVIQVPYGYLTVVEKHARLYCEGKPNVEKIIFGAGTAENQQLITQRTLDVFKHLGKEPDEIWCAVGSGTLISGISAACKTAKVYGVQVGAEFTPPKGCKNIEMIKYEKPFDKPSKFQAPFPSVANYDLKAYEKCVEYTSKTVSKDKCVLFWNVYGF
jgi:cysteine synthase